MRNPLNGLVQNADLVFESINNVREQILKFNDEFARCQNSTKDISSIAHMSRDAKSVIHLLKFLDEELTMDLESLESLNLCAKHQKRIADDVLQMSKLSMNLVSLSEIPFDPLVETTDAIRMFEREAFV